MDAELKAYLDERFAQVDRRFEAMEERFNRRFEAMEERFNRRFELIDDRIESTATKLLSAFYSWARTTDIRSRGAEERVRALEDRITDVEQRLNKRDAA